MKSRSGFTVIGSVLAATLGLAAWSGVSGETWAGISLLTTCGVLMLATIDALCRAIDERPRLIGFVVFGWGYFTLARWYSFHQGPMPTVCWMPGAGDIHNDLLALPPDVRIAHDAWALAFAVIGSALAGALFKDRSARARVNTHEGLTCEDEDTAGWWRGQAIIGLLGFGLVAVAAVLASARWEPESWAGAAFLLTWLLVGVAVLGAVCARGKRRAGLDRGRLVRYRLPDVRLWDGRDDELADEPFPQCRLSRRRPDATPGSTRR